MDALERLRQAIADGPDPVDGAARLHRFAVAAEALPGGLAACVPDERAAGLLALLLGQSPALARDIIREPLRLAALAGDPHLDREKPEAAMGADCARAIADAGDVARGLRRFRDQEYLRLGARELHHGTGEEVGRELAALAAVCLDAAVAAALDELRARHGEPLTDERGPRRRCRFVAFGMGKLGGQELNFSSDIDLIYLYESDVGAAGRLTLHEFFTRVAERATRLVADAPEGGAGFRVDLRLRPEGTTGPLVNSLPAAERYYETFGRPWERQAWIKARPVAGDLDLGEEALAVLEPFVWRRSAGAEVIEEIQSLRAKARAQLGDADDVKLGPGGIREVEFFAQALQLVHGGRRRELRERGTLRALDKLLFAGLVREREHRALGDAYVFLRRVEHRLQLEELRQTHAVPRASTERALLARRLGFADGTALDERLERHRARVRRIYATLGREADLPRAEVSVLLDEASDRAALEAALAALGFRDAEASADEMELLRRKPRSPFAPTASGDAARAAPLLLAEAAASPDPDLALRRLVDLTARGGAGALVWPLVIAAPALGRLLVSLFGTSDFLSKLLVARPELVESVLTAEPRARPVDAIAPDADEDAQLEALRRWRSEELVRIGLHDAAGELDVDDASRALTDLAERCLARTIDIVRPGVLRRFGTPATPLAVLGLGKLGARELTYSSDLDLVFVFGDEDARVDPCEAGGRAGTSAFEVMSRLAQRIVNGLSALLPSGRLYVVDTRLRPSGEQGTLVSSLGGFERYHAKEAALWERQALIKARTVAGDPSLGARVEAIARRVVWSPGTPLDAATAAQEIGRLRVRLERELARERPGRFDIKTGRGGLLDVEFLVQYLQLVHGPRDPSLRERATGPALDALAAAGLLDGETHAQLAAAWRFLRRLESRLRIVHDRPITELRTEQRAEPPTEPHAEPRTEQRTEVRYDLRERDKLARRLGYREAAIGSRSVGERLLDDYRAHTDRIRAIYRRWLPAPGD
jgi:glutamate-ammonia-ligase adenylyltransferase